MHAGSCAPLLATGRAFPTLSPFYLEHALPLITYLRSLPDPYGATASGLITSTYASIRGAYIEESLRTCAREALESAKPGAVAAAAVAAAAEGHSPRLDGVAQVGAGEGQSDRRTFGRFLDALLAIVKVRSDIRKTWTALRYSEC